MNDPDLFPELVQLAPRAADRAFLAGQLEIAREYGFEESHGLQVARLAVRLFDELQPLHALSARDRLLLASGGLLHDIGITCGYQRHHKHSRDLILDTDFLLLPRDRLLVANLVRYHRKSPPKAEHALWQTLKPDEQKRLKILAALLRLADGLDRLHADHVQDLRVLLEPPNVRVLVTSTAPLTVEYQAVSKKADLFREVFDLDVRLETTQKG